MGAEKVGKVPHGDAERGKGKAFNGVKVFASTMKDQREQLGERVTEWLRANPKLEIVDTVVSQSSDSAYHCLCITLFYNEGTV